MRLGSACAAALFALVGHACAQDTAALVQRLHRADAINAIDDEQMKPWHLKLSFQLFDDKGKPTETGTIEEWWMSHSMRKIVYTSPSFTATEVETKDGFYRTKGAERVPRLLEYILKQVVHPMVSDSEVASALPLFQQHDFGKTKLDCIMLARPKTRDFALVHFGN